MRSVEVKQHVVFYKTSRRLQQNNTSFFIKQAVNCEHWVQDRYLLLNA